MRWKQRFKEMLDIKCKGNEKYLWRAHGGLKMTEKRVIELEDDDVSRNFLKWNAKRKENE